MWSIHRRNLNFYSVFIYHLLCCLHCFFADSTLVCVFIDILYITDQLRSFSCYIFVEVLVPLYYDLYFGTGFNGKDRCTKFLGVLCQDHLPRIPPSIYIECNCIPNKLTIFMDRNYFGSITDKRHTCHSCTN